MSSEVDPPAHYCCDREAMSFVATTGGIGGEEVRDLMVAAIEHRFGGFVTLGK